MARDRNIIRRRDRGEEPEAEPASAALEPVAAPITAPRAADPHRHLDLGDLEAIAHMDMSEMDALMQASTSKKRVAVGTKVTGRIARLGRDQVFVEIGEKAEGMLAAEEMPDAKIGDEVTAYVLETDEEGIHLSKRLSGAAAAGFLEAAQQAGIPVEGRVASRNAGGFEVRIGAVRAFCPTSQMDRYADADADKYIGQTFDFKVVEIREGDVVVSRRSLIEAGLEERRKQFWETAKIGDTSEGVITSVQSFGVFVDCNGIDGLVPKRELSWDDETELATRFVRGTKLAVRIVDLDHVAKKVTLSAKDPSLSPWTRVGVDYVQGGTYDGVVARVAPYGAFVDLAPGLTGLLHASRGGKSAPKVGDKLSVRITGVDKERQRLELTSSDAADPEIIEGVGAIVKGTVTEVMKNGLVVDLEGGNTGWIPSREIDLPAGTILAQRFRAGKDIQARVVENDPSRRRSVLSMKLEQEDNASWQKAAKTTGGTSLGTFADLLSGLKLKK